MKDYELALQGKEVNTMDLIDLILSLRDRIQLEENEKARKRLVSYLSNAFQWLYKHIYYGNKKDDVERGELFIKAVLSYEEGFSKQIQGMFKAHLLWFEILEQQRGERYAKDLLSDLRMNNT